MEDEYYVADDGTIHRRRHPRRRNGNRNNNLRRADDYHASAGRKAAFWIISTIIAASIGVLLGMTGDEISYAKIIGAVVGSIVYGNLCAEDDEYNLMTYLYAAFAAVCGAFIAAIAVWFIGIAAAVAKFIVKAILIILLILLFLGGL